MAELDFESHLTLGHSHSELTSGHDVTHLLSQINQSFKQSKADQILRLLHDQDKLNEKLNDGELVEKEYNDIREETVICDSDTLTDSSSDGGLEDIDSQVDVDEVDATRNRKSAVSRYKSARCRTSVGFNNTNNQGSDGLEREVSNMDSNERLFDTRDLTIRPKSGYVRRSAIRRKDPNEENVHNDVPDDYYDSTQTQRLAKSAKQRPKSRLGRASIQRVERKIALVEADTLTVVPDEQPRVPTRDEMISGASRIYKRFSRVQTPKRDSNRAKGQFFAASNNESMYQNEENMCVETTYPSMDAREDTMTEVQPLNAYTQDTLYQSQPQTIVTNLNNTTVPRSSPVQPQMHIQAQPQHHKHNIHQPVRQDSTLNYHANNPHRVEPNRHHAPFVPPERSDSIYNNNNSNAIRSDQTIPSSAASVRRTDSNSSNTRPRNPEPIQSRPLDPRLVANAQRRRLTRRYMAPTQNPVNSMRPTSESVILARQKTEKNLIKKQQENRPHSEKMLVSTGNKNILSVNENPAVGPQTTLTSKAGNPQASHVQSSSFRSYGQGPTNNRLNSSTRKRELSISRPGQNNVMLGGRKPMALMKLPPLEAALAAKKKERGLTLAARETCV